MPHPESNPRAFGGWGDAPTNWATLARAIFYPLKMTESKIRMQAFKNKFIVIYLMYLLFKL